MLKLAAAARRIVTAPADEADEPPAPPTAAERLRADLIEAKGSTLRNAERVLRLARQKRAEASESLTTAIQDAVAGARAPRTSHTAAETAAARALAEADAAIAAPHARLQDARQSAEPRIRAAAVPHLAAAGEKLAAAAEAIGEVREILSVCSRFAAENGMTSAHWPHALPSAQALRELADRLARGVL